MPDLSSKLRIIIAAAILIPILLYWGFSGSPQEHSTSKAPLSEKMDYFIDQAAAKEWDIDGKLRQELTTPRLEHNPKEKQNFLIKPKSNHYRLDHSAINISSDTGTVLDDNSRIDLAGNVRVIDNSDARSSKKLTTEALTIYPKKDIAETNLPVNLETEHSRMKGTGMDINFNTRVLNLHSRVEGTHQNVD
ncbi:LPS export ABC transporter periplasmic protein LptC [Neptuniibacter sp. QD72_48]|uniref:LPS export ABC transporter periplasmic protein LptC n=1 Tax=Neptuniibacter sp. QD72_48 TaxID=3398214 RepID=UPI0039F5CB28